jgi:hypothetical protein
LRLSPVFIGLAAFVVVLSFLFKTPLGKTLSIDNWTALLVALILGGAVGYAGKAALKRFVDSEQDDGTEQVFRKIQIGTSCYVALAQGANDVANAIGPLAVIYFLVNTGTVGAKVPVPAWLLLFGGIGIACGIGMAGHRVMETIGTKITTLTNTRGFSVDFAAASTVLLASKMGLPVSTTHAAVGGVLGVGLAGGIEAVNFRIVFQIMLYWFLRSRPRQSPPWAYLRFCSCFIRAKILTNNWNDDWRMKDFKRFLLFNLTLIAGESKILISQKNSTFDPRHSTFPRGHYAHTIHINVYDVTVRGSVGARGEDQRMCLGFPAGH